VNTLFWGNGMARANQRDTQVRAALEGIAAELAVVQDTEPITRLRVVQAKQRSGLASLLEPALEELDQIGSAVATAQVQVCAALAVLAEKG
jgi:hypothetical protein